jgi:hypothetical protein
MGLIFLIIFVIFVVAGYLRINEELAKEKERLGVAYISPRQEWRDADSYTKTCIAVGYVFLFATALIAYAVKIITYTAGTITNRKSKK